jgi:hypothetical protein
MPNNTRLFVPQNYLELSDDFSLNNPIFIGNIKTNIIYLVVSELPSSFVK